MVAGQFPLAPAHTLYSAAGLKLSSGAESELSKGRNVMGGQLVFRHVIFPYAVKAEQMSPSIGRGSPGGLGETVRDTWPRQKLHN